MVGQCVHFDFISTRQEKSSIVLADCSGCLSDGQNGDHRQPPLGPGAPVSLPPCAQARVPGGRGQVCGPGARKHSEAPGRMCKVITGRGGLLIKLRALPGARTEPLHNVATVDGERQAWA